MVYFLDLKTEPVWRLSKYKFKNLKWNPVIIDDLKVRWRTSCTVQCICRERRKSFVVPIAWTLTKQSQCSCRLWTESTYFPTSCFPVITCCFACCLNHGDCRSSAVTLRDAALRCVMYIHVHDWTRWSNRPTTVQPSVDSSVSVW